MLESLELAVYSVVNEDLAVNNTGSIRGPKTFLCPGGRVACSWGRVVPGGGI